jgi:hypothetical protein
MYHGDRPPDTQQDPLAEKYYGISPVKIMGSVLLIIFQDRQSTNGNANETSNESL